MLTPAGSLLIAHPTLLDPNFRRSVLFISQHDQAEGSFGLVLNRPAGRRVSDFLPDREDIAPLRKLPVFLGGPVGRDQLLFASFQWQEEEETFLCKHHVALEDAIGMHREKRGIVRPFIGYAGWSKGQLEAELAQSAWLLKRPEQVNLELNQVPDLWRDLLGTFGPKFRLIADSPEDPSLN